MSSCAKRTAMLFSDAVARGLDDPAHRERLAARRTNLDRHLIGRAADAARLHFDRRLDVVERLAEQPRWRDPCRLPVALRTCARCAP